MAWYNMVTYTPPATTTSLGGVGGGWTDSGSQWQIVALSGTTGDTALKTTYNTSSPWQNAALVRRASAEQTNNLRVSIRWMSNGTGGISNAAEILARFDTSGNALIARYAQVWALASNATTGSSTNGTQSGTGYVAGNWYDTQISWVTSGSTTTITEKTWTVTNELTSAFASGTLVSPAAGNSWTSTLYPNVTAAAGIYFYQPSTNGGFIKYFASDTDVPASSISLTPATATVQVGVAQTFTVSVPSTGAQNGGAITLSDGGKGGTFSPASPTMPTGLGASVTFTYTPATTGSITITASSSALTGTALSATATITGTAAAATALGLSPSSIAVIAGQASSNYTVAAAGVLSSSATVTLTDGSQGGTFTPSSVTLAAGTNSSATFTYTPSSSSATQSTTLTAAASGLTSAAATAAVTMLANHVGISPLTMNTAAGVATGSYTVTANGGLTATTTFSFNDHGAGGTFTPASVNLAAGTTSSGTFTYTPAGTASGTITLTGTAPGLSAADVNVVVTASATALAVSPTTQSVLAGVATNNYTVTTNAALSSSATVTLSDSSAGGTFSPSSLTLASGSSPSGTFTYTPAVGASGSVTLTAAASGLSSATTAAVVTAAASALALSPSTQGAAPGTPTGAYTVSLASGGLASAKTVTLSDGGAGGTFTPTSVTLAAGTGGTATFTYTPSSTGTKTLTVSATGLTSASAAAVSSASSVITPTNSAVVMSPHNWITGVANTTTGDNTAIRTWYTGAYLRIIVQGATTLGIAFGACYSGATFDYTIDEKEVPQPISITANSTYNITLPSTGIHLVIFKLQSIPQVAGRWAGTTSIVVNGFILGTGGSTLTNTPNARKLLIYGDSITEGTQSKNGSDGMTTGYAFAFAEAMRKTKQFEYSIKGAGYSGIAWATPSANGGQPPAWTASNDTLSSYNKIDGSGAAGAALTTGTPGSASEQFITQPDLIVINWGTNDGNQGVAAATIQASAQGLLVQLRVCAPNAVIVVIVPFGGFARAPLTAAVAAMLDSKIILVDPQTDARMTTTFYCGDYVAGVAGTQNIHPWSWGSAQLASIVTRLVVNAYTPFQVARAYGSAS